MEIVVTRLVGVIAILGLSGFRDHGRGDPGKWLYIIALLAADVINLRPDFLPIYPPSNVIYP